MSECSDKYLWYCVTTAFASQRRKPPLNLKIFISSDAFYNSTFFYQQLEFARLRVFGAHQAGQRFLAHRESVAGLYDERFVRMWEFYLAGSEMAFRKQAMMVFQIQLAKRQNVVPMTRDYIERESARLRAFENRRQTAFELAAE